VKISCESICLVDVWLIAGGARTVEFLLHSIVIAYKEQTVEYRFIQSQLHIRRRPGNLHYYYYIIDYFSLYFLRIWSSSWI